MTFSTKALKFTSIAKGYWLATCEIHDLFDPFPKFSWKIICAHINHVIHSLSGWIPHIFLLLSFLFVISRLGWECCRIYTSKLFTLLWLSKNSHKIFVPTYFPYFSGFHQLKLLTILWLNWDDQHQWLSSCSLWLFCDCNFFINKRVVK